MKASQKKMKITIQTANSIGMFPAPLWDQFPAEPGIDLKEII
jgi:hypothetical protein